MTLAVMGANIFSGARTKVFYAISLLFDSNLEYPWTFGTRASIRYCPVYKDTGETRYALLPVNEMPRHGWRQWENLAASPSVPVTQDITVVVGHTYCVTIGADSAVGATAVCSNSFSSTLIGDATDRKTSEAKVATTTTLTVTITGSITDLLVEDQSSLPVADQGIPNEFATTIGWSRYTNGNTVAANVVTEGVGTLIPLTQRYNYAPEPELTNKITYPRDFNLWSVSGTPTCVHDQVGFDGLPNTACTLGDDIGTDEYFFINNIAIPADTNTHSFSFKIGIDTDETRFPGLKLTCGANVSRWQINTKTGASIAVGTNHASAAINVLADGDFYNVITSVANDGVATVAACDILPADSWVFGSSANQTTGTIIADQAEFHENTTISQLLHASPIPDGEGSAFTKNADVFESATLGAVFPQAAGACLVEWRPSVDYTEYPVSSIVAVSPTEYSVLYAHPASGQFTSYDNTTFARLINVNPTALTSYKAASYWGASFGIVVDAFAGAGVSYDGSFLTDGVFRLHYAITHPMYFDSVRIIKPQPSVTWIQGQQL